jgi:hypothetical protein
VRLEQAGRGDAALDAVADVCEGTGWRADGSGTAVEEDLEGDSEESG